MKWSVQVAYVIVYGLGKHVKLPWIFPGAPLIFNGAPGNIQGNFTGMQTVCTVYVQLYKVFLHGAHKAEKVHHGRGEAASVIQGRVELHTNLLGL